MTFAAPTQEPPPNGTSDYCIEAKHVEARSDFEIRPTKKMSFVHRKRLVRIEGGRFILRLREDPVILVDVTNLECEVEGWGVFFPHSEIHDLDRKLAKRFLFLFAKADGQTLNEADEAAWLSILDRVDFEEFCFDRAAPRYMEGTLVRLLPDTRVEWHDGTIEKLPKSFCSTLEFLDPGDRFGAYVHLDREGKARDMERILPLV